MVLPRYLRVYTSTPEEWKGLAIENRKTNKVLLIGPSGKMTEKPLKDVPELKVGYIKFKDVYGCLGMVRIPSAGGERMYMCFISECKSDGKLLTELFHISAAEFVPLVPGDAADETSLLGGFKKLFASGSFFFSSDTSFELQEDESSPTRNTPTALSYDITNRWQDQKKGMIDSRFFWSRNMWQEFMTQGISSEWLVVIIRGSVNIKTCYIGALQCKTALISRLSCSRTGARFHTRGVDDEGNVATFVETEQLLMVEKHILSVVLLRGSVPIFWEQPGFQVGSHKVRISRGFEATKPAFDRHIEQLTRHYGDQVFLNLLSRQEGEFLLSNMFQKHITESKYVKSVPLIQFDVHRYCKGRLREQCQPIISQISEFLTQSGFYHFDGEKEVNVQSGATRVNCLDCLDRTNFVQAAIAWHLLDAQLAVIFRSEHKLTTDKSNKIHELFHSMWRSNGDDVSRCIAGTGAIGGDAMSKVKDLQRTVTRTIKNNFYDQATQEVVDIMLGKNTEGGVEQFSFVIPDAHLRSIFEQAVSSRKGEYSRPLSLNICCGTWNVNGGKNFRSIAFKNVSMSDWLVEPIADQEVDVYAIGFEEIVDLTAQNMVATESKNRREWGEELRKVFNSGDSEYALVVSHQLVGVCLFIFINARHLHGVKDVGIDLVKTGAKGNVGNKGGVAIRFRMYDSSLCFICAHFAAGQNHVEDRNQDFLDIYSKLNFGKGRDVASHDYAFWFGDFNYRINLGNDECKELIKTHSWQALQDADQLLIERKRDTSKVFEGFTEGPLLFCPTYKYDLFSDDFDTSEKCRCPAWTDRILFRGPTCKLLHYGRNETLKTSDHRPVMALVRIDVHEVNETLRHAIQEKVLEDLRANSPNTISLHPVVDDPGLMEELSGCMAQYGAVSMIELEDDTALITFVKPESAKAALVLNKTQFRGQLVVVSMTQSAGKDADEISLGGEEGVEREAPLPDEHPPSNDDCSEDDFPLFDRRTERAARHSSSSSLTMAEGPIAPPRPLSLPPGKNDEDGSGLRKGPPARPPPPCRPPPPIRGPGTPSTPSLHPSSSTTTPRPRPKPSAAVTVTPTTNKTASLSIGMPFNVVHRTHASFADGQISIAKPEKNISKKTLSKDTLSESGSKPSRPPIPSRPSSDHIASSVPPTHDLDDEDDSITILDRQSNQQPASNVPDEQG